MSRSFRPEFTIYHPGQRSPSPPPRSAIEPLSPPPEWNVSLRQQSRSASSRKRKYTRYEHEEYQGNGTDVVNGLPRNPTHGLSKMSNTPSMRPHSPPSALDVFAAVATSPSLAQDINSPSTFHSPSTAAFPQGYSSTDHLGPERSSKRSRSEVFSERPAILQDNRPITSHVPSLAHHYGQSAITRNHAVQSNEVLEQDAELLLMFSRGSHNQMPLFPIKSDAQNETGNGNTPLLGAAKPNLVATPFDIMSSSDQRSRESKPLLPSFAHALDTQPLGYFAHSTEQPPADAPFDPPTLQDDTVQAPELPRPREHRGWPKGKPRGPRGPGAARKRKGESGNKRPDFKDGGSAPATERKRGKQRKGANNSPSNEINSDTFAISEDVRRSRRHSFHAVRPEAHRLDVPPSSSKRNTSAPRDPYAGALICERLNNVLRVSSRGKKRRRSPDDTEFCLLCKADTKTMPATQDLWINCNGCKAWIHAGCAGFENEKTIKEVDKYYCKRCESQHGQTTYVRKSSRAHASVDYAGLNEGKIRAPEDVFGHHYIEPIKNGTFKFPPETFARMPPELVNADYFAKIGGWKEPILIPAELNPRPKAVSAPGESAIVPETSNPDECTGSSSEDAFSAKFEYECVPDEGQDKLDMVMPHGLTVRRVADLHGPETKLAVIDVKMQEGEDKWSLGRWADYYEATGDKPVRNVISLEVSRSKLGRLIRRPKVVRDLDLQDSVWPEEETAKGNFPRVQFYCLMSVADCYTDFHIDFGGSSVYYHILKGRKTFFFIPPTQKNLKKYEDWCKSPNQNNIWLGDETKECYRVDLFPGDTMLIPSGWIHSVWTPEDSLVIGGNFLTRLHYGMQINVHAIEKATEVSAQFRYPFFQKIMWLALARYLERDPVPSTVVDLLSSGEQFERREPIWISGLTDDIDNEDGDDPEFFNARYYPEAEMEGLPELLRFVHRTAMIAQGLVPGITKKHQEAVNRSIPKGYGDAIELLKTAAIWAAWKRGNEVLPPWALPDAPLSEADPVAAEKKLSLAAQKRLERQAILDAVKRDPNARTLRPANEKSSVESPPVKVSSPTASSGSGGDTSTRPACDHCRSRKRRCYHKATPADNSGTLPSETAPPRFGVKVISRTPELEVVAADESLTIESAPIKREIPPAEVVVKPAPPTPAPLPAQVNPIQMPTVPSAEALQFNAAQFAAPLPPLGMQTPTGSSSMAGVDHSPLTQSKRPKTKACADCKKSKRRCIHDEYGQIDPIKAQETPQPRGQTSTKRSKSGEHSRPSSSKKTKRESDAATDFSTMNGPPFIETNYDTAMRPVPPPPALADAFGLHAPVEMVLDPALASMGLPEQEEQQNPRQRSGASTERKERSRSRTSSSNQQTSGSDSAKAAYSTTASPLTEPDAVPPYFNGAAATAEAEPADQVMTDVDNDRQMKPAVQHVPVEYMVGSGPNTSLQGPDYATELDHQKMNGSGLLQPPEDEEDESVKLARLLAGQEHGLRRRG